MAAVGGRRMQPKSSPPPPDTSRATIEGKVKFWERQPKEKEKNSIVFVAVVLPLAQSYGSAGREVKMPTLGPYSHVMKFGSQAKAKKPMNGRPGSQDQLRPKEKHWGQVCIRKGGGGAESLRQGRSQTWCDRHAMTFTRRCQAGVF